MKIYTKTGDRGTTSLIGGTRVDKDDLRVEAYGSVDELTGHIALLRDSMNDDAYLIEEYDAMLIAILGELMTLSSLLALEDNASEKIISGMPSLDISRVERLEEWIDRISSSLPQVNSFTIPGGHVMVSRAHICRTVCRRAERAVVKASHNHCVNDTIVRYLNRLSDLLYVVGRRLTIHLNVVERYWNPHG